MDYFNELKKRFSRLDGVEALMLGGSRATGTADKDSDYDLYVYCTKEISLIEREKIANECCQYMELNNRFWETEDDGVLKDGIPIDIIYRGLDWIEESLRRTVICCEADTGYTGAIWHNFISSKLLFDKNGRCAQMQSRFSVPYPELLKKAVIAKNYPLLRGTLPAYLGQIEKAIKRGDLISINHRISALLESYFDIIFAVNELPHEGEKKIINCLENKGKKLPYHMREDIEKLLSGKTDRNKDLPRIIKRLIDRLDALLKEELLI